LTSGWHSAVTQPVRGIDVVGRVAVPREVGALDGLLAGASAKTAGSAKTNVIEALQRIR
jgi:hypothetical protein